MDVDLMMKLGKMVKILHNDKESILFGFEENVTDLDKIKFGIYMTGNMVMFRYCKKTNSLTTFYKDGTVVVHYHKIDNDFEARVFMHLLIDDVKGFYFLCSDDKEYQYVIPYSIKAKKANNNSGYEYYEIFTGDNYIGDINTKENIQEYIKKHFKAHLILEDIGELEYKIESVNF